MRLLAAIASVALPLGLCACDSLQRAVDQASQPKQQAAPREQAAQTAPPQPVLDPGQPAESLYPAQRPVADSADAAKLAALESTARSAAAETARGERAECGFADLPADTRVYAAGAYGGRELGFRIDRSGHQATQIDVAVDDAAPVALMLGAYEPTVWKLGWSRRTRIVAVLVGGYHHQVVSGLPADVPLRISSYDNGSPCGYFYVEADGAAKLSALAQRAFALPLRSIHLAQQGRAQIGAGDGAWISDDTTPAPQSFRIADAQPAGRATVPDSDTLACADARCARE